VQQMWVNCS